MPGFQLVQGFTEARLARGIDAREAAELRAFVLDGRPTPNDVQAEQLLRLSALYADYFTPAAKSTWQKLTGIDVEKAESTWKKSARLYANVLDARIDIAAEKARIRTTHVVKETARGIHVDSRFLASDVAARSREAPAPIGFTQDGAVAFDAPLPLLEAGLASPRSAVVAGLVDELVRLEKTVGDGDGTLAPRDLKGAPPHLAAVMQAVWQRHGERALSIDAHVKAALPRAVLDVALGGSRQENRLGGDSGELFRRALEDGLNHLAAGLVSDVIRGDVPYTLFLEKHGIVKTAHKGEVLRLLEGAVPPPTLDEIVRLYERAVDGKLQARDFYAAARLTKEDLFQLQAAFPDRLPREPGQKHSAALSAPRVLDATASSSTLSSLDDLAAAWASEVTTGKTTVEQFVRDHGVRLNVLTGLRAKHPARFPDPPRSTSPADRQAAEAFAAALQAAAAADPFAGVKELVARVNETEPALVGTHGELTYSRYYDIRKKNPDLFGRVDDSSRWQVPVAAKVKEIMAQRPDLSRNALVEELQKTWPQMTYSRLSHLKEADPSVPIPGSYNRKKSGDIDAMASRLVALLQEDPSTTHERLAQVLSAERGEKIDRPYVSSIIRDFRPHLFTGVGKIDDKRLAPRRQSVVAHGLLQLAIRAAPPGARVEHVLETLNRMLEERGVGRLEAGYLPRLTQLAEKKGLPGPSAVHARMTAQIVAEYAAAAKKGASEADILAAVQKDWPTLDGLALGRFRGLWRKSPRDFPELAPFMKGKEVELVGLGKAVKEPRWIGGHDPARQLARAPKEEQEQLARFAELAAIPLKLDEIDAVIQDLAGSTPLKQANVLWVSHLLGDIVPMGFALKDAGAESSRTIVVGTPYGTNPSVKGALEDMGFSVRKPKLDVDDYKRVVAKAIDDIIAVHKKNKEPICVLDDGGLVSHILHSDEKYAPYRKKFRIVEQTTGGLLLAEKHALESVVVNVARSKSKALEGEAIGEVVAAKIVQALARFGDGLKGKEVSLIGYGVIGPAIASEMMALGAKVTIIERNKTRAAEARKIRGLQVVLDDPTDPRSQEARSRAIARADLLVGATGRRTISLDDMKRMKPGAAIASASSKRIEAAMEDLEKAATRREELPSEEILVTLPTARYRLPGPGGGKDLFVIGDGFPVNFDGGVQSVPPQKIQLTDAAMLAALFQASRIGNTQKGVVDLDPATDERLLARHRAGRQAETEKPAVYDPAKWRDVILDTARLYDRVARDG